MKEVKQMNYETICPTSFHLASLQGRLASELKKSFGEAPAIANAIAETADKIYGLESNLTIPGTILYSVVSVSEPSGKLLDVCQRVSVKLSLWGTSDLKIKDMKNRKKEVFRRITQEAYDQEGVLTIEDCEHLMLTSKRTLKQYLSEFKQEKIYLPLRGYVHSTGRGQTHKTEIICFYLEGMEFTDIQRRTYHSISAITRYISTFSKIIICHEKQKMKIFDIATVVNVSPELVKQYLKIYEKYAAEENSRLEIILNPVQFNEFIMPLKKKVIAK